MKFTQGYTPLPRVEPFSGTLKYISSLKIRTLVEDLQACHLRQQIK